MNDKDIDPASPEALGWTFTNGQRGDNGDASADLPAVEPLEANDGKAPEDGAAILDDVATFIDRFCAFPSTSTASVLALWATWSHMYTEFHSGPRVALLSPEPGSGKTRVLEVLATLTRNPFFAVSPNPAPLFRTLDDAPTTLLLDETDAIFSRYGKDDENQDVRTLLNTGYKRGATVPRCIGESQRVYQFSAYAPAALAGLGDLPDTVMSRSIVIRMRRRARHENVEAWRDRAHEPEGNALRDKLEAWAASVAADAGAAWPALPDGVEDREAEKWEPLVAVADAAGGHWPEVARETCRKWTAAVEQPRSLRIELLAHIRYVFDVVFGGADRLSTQALVDALRDLEEAPWADLRGGSLDARGLARRLAEFDVYSTTVRTADGKVAKGYHRADFEDPWDRYLGAGAASPLQALQGLQPELAGGSAVTDEGACNGESVTPVTPKPPSDQGRNGCNGRNAPAGSPPGGGDADGGQPELDDSDGGQQPPPPSGIPDDDANGNGICAACAYWAPFDADRGYPLHADCPDPLEREGRS